MSAATPNVEPPAHEERSGTLEHASSAKHAELQYGVRGALPADAYDLAWAKALSWQVAHEQKLVPVARDPQDFYGDVRRFSQRIAGGSLPVFVAMRAGQLVGYLALSEVGPLGVQAARIDSAHVLPVYWRERAGDNLVLAAEAWLFQRGFTELWIHVLTANATAQQFLVQQGFQSRDARMRKGHLHTRYVKQLRES